MPSLNNFKIDNALLFTENVGQINDENILYITRAKNINIYIKKNGLIFQFKKLENAQELDEFRIEYNNSNLIERTSLDKMRPNPIYTYKIIEMNLVNSNSNVNIIPSELDEYYENHYKEYYKCECIRNYKKVTIQNIYDGIDWVIYSKDDWIKYDFVINPNADPFQINMSYIGHNEIVLDNNKKIIIKGDLGEVSDDILLVTQGDQIIDSSYNYNQTNVTYNIGEYDKTKQLIIDPAIAWATYYGGSSDDYPIGIVTDVSANLYLAGVTGSSTDISGGSPVFQGTLNVAYDLFIVKLTPNGQRIWATYYGGNGTDFNSGGIASKNIAIDNSSNIIFGSKTFSSTVVVDPSQVGVWRATAPWGTGGSFIAKFNSNGQRIMSTHIIGSADLRGVACDSSNNIYAAGSIDSNPATYTITDASSHQQTWQAGGSDGYLIKLTPNGQRIWGTYYGGTGLDYIRGLAIDISNNVIITGQSFSTAGTFIATAGSPDTTGDSTNGDAFLAKFNPNGQRIWGTYRGATSQDSGSIVSCDKLGNIYVTNNIVNNSTTSNAIFFYNTNNPPSAPTTYSITGAEIIYNIIFDSTNKPYFVGSTTTSTGFATFGPAFNTTRDGFIMKCDNSFNKLWAAYLGGNSALSEDYMQYITFDISENIYTAGYTVGSTSGIVTGGTSVIDPSNSSAGNNEVILYKIENTPSQPTNVTAGTFTSSRATISWTDVTDENSYIILYSPNSSYSPSFSTTAALNATSKILTDLSGNQLYFAKVGAVNLAGTNFSTDVSFTTAPSPPTDLSGVNASINTITLSWSDSAGATVYDLSRNGTLIPSVTSGTLNNGGSGLSAGTSYSYAVRAKTATATGDWSSPVTVFTKSNPPTNLSRTVGQNSATLSWTNATGATSYTIQRDISSGYTNATTITGTSSGVAGNGGTDLSSGTLYFFRVASVNSSGTGSYSTDISARTLSAAPTNLTGVNVTTSSIRVGWTGAVGATSYWIQRSSNNFSTIDICFNTTDLSQNFSGLSAGTDYFFRAASVNSSGIGSFSPTETISTLSNPPTDLSAQNITTNSMELTWTAATSADSYWIQQSSDNFSTIDICFNTTDLSQNFSGLNIDTFYYFQIASQNSSGIGPFSGIIIIPTISNPPTDLSAQNITTNSMKLTWTGTNTGINYWIEQSFDNFSTIDICYNVTDISQNFTGLSSGSIYYFRAASVNSSGISAYTSITAPTIADPPNLISLNSNSISTIDVSWTIPSGNSINTYYIDYDISSGFSTKITINDNTPPTQITDLSAGTEYFIRMYTQNDSGISAYVQSDISTISLPIINDISGLPYSVTDVSLDNVIITFPPGSSEQITVDVCDNILAISLGSPSELSNITALGDVFIITLEPSGTIFSDYVSIDISLNTTTNLRVYYNTDLSTTLITDNSNNSTTPYYTEISSQKIRVFTKSFSDIILGYCITGVCIGDPFISPIYGNSYYLPNDEDTYLLLDNNNNLRIYTKTWLPPDYPNKLSYMKYIIIDFNDERICLDLDTMNWVEINEKFTANKLNRAKYNPVIENMEINTENKISYLNDYYNKNFKLSSISKQMELNFVDNKKIITLNIISDLKYSDLRNNIKIKFTGIKEKEISEYKGGLISEEKVKKIKTEFIIRKKHKQLLN